MKIKTCLLFTFLSVFINAQNTTFSLDTLFTNLYNKGQFNGNVLIAEKGKVLFQKSYGIANEIDQTKLTTNSVFDIASCSKQFTAFAVAILEDRKKLNYDDELGKYIPELSFYKGITIRHLLNHTSGLPDYIQLTDSLWDKTKIATNADLIRLYQKHQPKVLFEANSKFEYSNTGYAFLCTIIEKVSGMSLPAFLKKEIFAPLKMNQTRIYSRRLHPVSIKNYAWGYILNEDKKKVLPDSIASQKMVYYLDGIYGDGAINSTVNDLFIWINALEQNKLLSKDKTANLYKPAILKDSTESNYGFGWALNNHPKFGKMLAHGGYWPGYKAYIERELDQEKVIIILTNLDDAVIPTKLIRSLINK